MIAQMTKKIPSFLRGFAQFAIENHNMCLCQVLRIAMLHANASFASVRALVRLNTGEFLNALRLNDEIRRGVPRKRSTSSNHTSRTLVFLGRFPMRPVTQSASSYGLASWTGQYFSACSTRVCFGTSQSAFFRNNYHRTHFYQLLTKSFPLCYNTPKQRIH